MPSVLLLLALSLRMTSQDPGSPVLPARPTRAGQALWRAERELPGHGLPEEGGVQQAAVGEQLGCVSSHILETSLCFALSSFLLRAPNCATVITLSSH